MSRTNTAKLNSFKRQSLIAGYSFVALPVIGFCLFTLVPLILSIVMVFSDFDLTTFSGAAVGGKYISIAFGDKLFWSSMINTLFTVVGLLVQIIVSLLVACLLTVHIKGQTIFRAFFFIPSLCSAVAITYVWKVLYDAQYGLINSIIWAINPTGWAPDWLGDPAIALISVMIKGIWMGIGGGMVMYISALKNAPKSLYEAADIDGAGTVRKFFSVTLPIISPTTFYILITSIIGYMTDFATYYLMIGENEEALNYSATTAALYIYNTAFFKNPTSELAANVSYASTMSWILSLIIIGLVILLFASSKKWVHYND